MKLLRVFFVWVATVLTLSPADAAVTKAVLRLKIEQRSTIALLSQVTDYSETLTDSQKKSVRSKIAERTKFFSSAINNIPEAEVDEKLSQWIEDSFVAEITQSGLNFLNQNSDEDALYAYKRT